MKKKTTKLSVTQTVMFMVVLPSLLFTSLLNAEAENTQWSIGREGDALSPAISAVYEPYDWKDSPPESTPHEQSKEITGIRFTGRYANYTGADTFYPMWANDGHMYSAWTDGYFWTDRDIKPTSCKYCNKAWDHLAKNSGLTSITNKWQKGTLKPYHCHSNVKPYCIGQCKIVGDSPLELRFTALGKMYSGSSLYPCINVIANGVYYIGSYSAFDDGGRFNGFRYSKDWNHWAEELNPGWKNPYWTDTRKPETDFWSTDQNPRRFNVPHAVVFGQDNKLSPDGKIYLTAHGQLQGGTSNWDKGDAIYLCRVDPEPEAVSNPESYEFFSGRDKNGDVKWSGDIKLAQPILEWKNHLGSESITYIPGLKKYLLMTTRLKESEKNLPSNVFIFYEADTITGPYRMVHYLRDWGPQAYFPNVPSKFISVDGKKMWLCVACNYSSKTVPKPFQCRYSASFHEIELVLPKNENESESSSRSKVK